MAELTQRAASLRDFKDIWGLMGRVAADAPFDFKSEAEQESILSELMACCISGLSPIAVGEDKSIVGALLVRRDVPVFASVKAGNRCGLADALKELGFAHECAAADGWGDLYKWQPAASS